MKNNLETLANSATIIIIGLFLSKVLNYIFRIIVARNPTIGTEGYGTLSIALAFFGIISLFNLFGLNQGIMRYIPFYQNNQDKINDTISTSLIITSILSIATATTLFIFSNYISLTIFNDPNLTNLLKLIAIAIPLETTKLLFLAILKAYKKAKYEAYIKNIFEHITKIILTLVFIYMGYQVFGIGLAILFTILLSLIVTIIPTKQYLKRFIPKNIDKKIIQHSWPLLISTMVILILSWTDTFMLGGILKDSSLVGIYNAAIPTAQVMNIIPIAVFVILVPILTDLFVKNDKKESTQLLKTITKWILISESYFLLLFIFFGKQTLSLLFGAEYVSGYLSLTIIASGLFIYFTFRSYEYILQSIGKTRLIFYISILVAALNISLNYILIPKMGITGAAIATGSTYALYSLLLLLIGYKITKIFPFNIDFLKIPILATLTFATTYLIIPNPTGNITTLILIFSTLIIYLISLLITRCFIKEDFIIINIIKKKIR